MCPSTAITTMQWQHVMQGLYELQIRQLGRYARKKMGEPSAVQQAFHETSIAPLPSFLNLRASKYDNFFGLCGCQGRLPAARRRGVARRGDNFHGLWHRERHRVYVPQRLQHTASKTQHTALQSPACRAAHGVLFLAPPTRRASPPAAPAHRICVGCDGNDCGGKPAS